MKSLLGLVLVFAAFGCGEKDPNVKKPTASPAPTQNTNEGLQLNGKNPADFYNGFLYSEAAPAPLKYRFVLSSSQPIGEKTADATKQICADFSLFLLSSKTFTLDYRESYCVTSAARPETQVPLLAKRFTGQWQVNKMDLVIGDLMIGTGSQLNGKDVIGFHFMKPIRTANLQTPLFVGAYVQSNMGMAAN